MENWVYRQADLENYLNQDDYLELISFDFGQKFALLELDKLLKNYLDYPAFYGFELKQTLLALQNKPSNLKLLAEIYDDYCYGYFFLQKLAMDYGYFAMSALDDGRNDFRFSTEELIEIQNQAKLLYTAIDTGKIILLKSTNFFEEDSYQDLR